MINTPEEPLDHWFAHEILVHEHILVRYLLRVWPNRDEVPDLRQDIYVRIFEAARQSRPQLPKAFLFATARHLMVDRLRRRRVVFIGTRGDLDELNVLVDELSAERRATDIQELQRLAKSFDSLPTQCRKVMWLRKVEQLSQKEVAARLGVQEKAIEKQVARGMRLLTAALLEASSISGEGESRRTGVGAESGESESENEHG